MNHLHLVPRHGEEVGHPLVLRHLEDLLEAAVGELPVPVVLEGLLGDDLQMLAGLGVLLHLHQGGDVQAIHELGRNPDVLGPLPHPLGGGADRPDGLQDHVAELAEVVGVLIEGGGRVGSGHEGVGLLSPGTGDQPPYLDVDVPFHLV